MRHISHTKPSFFDLELGDLIMIGDQPYIVHGARHGGMGCVYFVEKDYKNAPSRTDSLSSRLALKAILPHQADAEGLALFNRELTVWSNLRHYNIIGLLEIVDGGGAGWVAAMEWCHGSLRELIQQRGCFPLPDSTKILSNLINGLSYAYSQDGIHHLDLKPENIIYKGNVNSATLEHFHFMLADWGIASIKQPQLNAIAGMPPSAKAIQQTFNNMGTLIYMAPERFQMGYASSIASDVFSLGIIYMELLTGNLPFRSNVQVHESLISGQYLPDSKEILKKAKVPLSVGQLIIEMISFQPSDRPSDYSTLKKKLLLAWKKSNSVFSRSFK